MRHYPTMIAGTAQDPPTGAWHHVPYAKAMLTDPFRTTDAVLTANTTRGRQTGFAGAVAASTSGQNTLAMHAAHAAQPAWAARSVAERLAVVARFHSAVTEHWDELVDLLIAEGHPALVARWQVAAILSQTHPATLAQALEALGSTTARLGRQVTLRRVPLGVVGIQPSGACAAFDAAGGIWALAAGNAVIVNCPPEQPLATAYLYHQLIAPCLAASGAPPGVLSVLSTPGWGAVDDWVTAPHCDAVWATTNRATGREVELACVAGGKRAIVDVPGSDGVLVWSDADLPAAVQVLAERFYASGQLRMAPSYALAHPAIAEKLVDMLAERAAELRPGLPSQPEVLLSPVTNRYIYTAQLEQALNAGARLAYGGELWDLGGKEHPSGPFAQPAVLWVSNANAADLECLREPGGYPLATVVVLDAADDAARLGWAISHLNRDPYTLRNTIWAQDPKVIARCVAQVHTGGILNINDSHLRSLPGMPGDGSTGGAWGEAAQPWVRTTRLQAVADGTALGGFVAAV
jgi:acyl-CoA reductase-like NAD-dependent aldehyde dehydrogenase